MNAVAALGVALVIAGLACAWWPLAVIGAGAALIWIAYVNSGGSDGGPA